MSTVNVPDRYWGNYSQLPHVVRSPHPILWLPLPFGMIKVNFDASTVPNKAAVGYIIRDHNVRLLQAGINFYCIHLFPLLS